MGRIVYMGPAMGNMHFTERFTKVDAHTVDYTVTLDDLDLALDVRSPLAVRRSG